jgi:hypothetical protein
MKTPKWMTPSGGKVRDSRLVPGCWVESKRFGLCVLIAIRDEWFDVRYEANHLATQSPLWIASTDNKVVFKQAADDKSREVLAAEGAFGIGEGRSDPRM